MVEGRAVQVTDNDTLRRLAEDWVMKWDGRWRFEVGEDCFLHSGGHGRVLVFAVTPDRMLAFGKAKFTRTSHGSDPGRGSARWRGAPRPTRRSPHPR